MSVYVAPFTFRFETSVIDVDSGTADVDCDQMYDALKLAQASEEGIIYDRIGKGSGLDTLGPGVQVGLTVELLGAWQLRFATGNYIARVAGGNLIGGPGGDPIAYSAGVQTLLIQSAASTVVNTGGAGQMLTDVWQHVSAIKAKTDNLPPDPAGVSNLLPVPTASDNATAVLLAAEVVPIRADIRKVNAYTISGEGTASDPWGPA